MAKPDKHQGREALMLQFCKDFGATAMLTLDRDLKAQITHYSSTGIFELDEATTWGLPGGRISEWFGPESSGKTTAAMAAMIENARRGGTNIVVDAEGTFDSDRYRQMGGNPEEVLTVEVSDLESFYDQMTTISKWAAKQKDIPETAVILVVVDTITTVLPRAVLKLEDDAELMAASSRVNSRRLPTIDQNMPGNMHLLLLSQIRDKMGGSAWNADGNIDTPGGHVIKHHASIRVLFKNAGQLDNGRTKEARAIVGIKTAFKVVKNKVAPPHRKGEFRIMFDDRGIDNLDSFLKRLVTAGIVKKGTMGRYSVAIKDRTATFKSLEFAGVLTRVPKWTAKQLSAVYSFQREGIALEGALAFASANRDAQDDESEEAE